MTAFRDLLDSIERPDRGPISLARELDVDNVLASRVLRATRSKDPLSATHMMPGPEPLRRLLKAAERRGCQAALIEPAKQAVDRFDALIRHRVGHRGALDAILSSWIPEARREFELRRKQLMYRGLTQLKGVEAETQLVLCVLSPSENGRDIDILWLLGLFGLRRVRPGACAKVTTRRFPPAAHEHTPETLDGRPIEEVESLLLREFCSDPLPPLQLHRTGNVVHYLLGDERFDPNATANFVFAEKNPAAQQRYPSDPSRVQQYFAEIETPSRVLHFDLLVDTQLYVGHDPSLRIYDSACTGPANANDRSRDVDRLDLQESIEPLGAGSLRLRSADVPRYNEMVRHMFKLSMLNLERFRGYRCRIDYPMYGTQVMMTFPAARE